MSDKIGASEIGGVLRERRQDLCMTMKDVADELGCSESMISRYETAANAMSVGTMLRWADVLDADAREMLDEARRRAEEVEGE